MTAVPDFYNWNRVKLRYCDGGSFTGDRVFNNGVIFSMPLCRQMEKTRKEVVELQTKAPPW